MLDSSLPSRGDESSESGGQEVSPGRAPPRRSQVRRQEDAAGTVCSYFSAHISAISSHSRNLRLWQPVHRLRLPA